jgi:hypothetical protein
MKLQEVVDAARYSELNSVAVKDNDAAIVTFLNLGMLELYKRFPLKTKEHVITLTTENRYSLPSDYMYALEAYDDSDRTADKPDAPLVDIAINDTAAEMGIFFPNHTEVQVPFLEDRTFISIVYVAKPTSYTVDDLDAELELPETLVSPLLHYIGYKGHLGIRGDGQAENNAHWIRFDRSCQEARKLGVAYSLDSWHMPDRLKDRGFA